MIRENEKCQSKFDICGRNCKQWLVTVVFKWLRKQMKVKLPYGLKLVATILYIYQLFLAGVSTLV